MRALFNLFFSFRGRISRKMFWLGFVVVIAAQIAGEYWFNPEDFSEPYPVSAMTVGEAVLMTILAVAATAVAVKRFNDMAWLWWSGYLVGGIGLLEVGAEYFFGFQRNTEVNSTLDWIGIALTFGVFFLIWFERLYPRHARAEPLWT